MSNVTKILAFLKHEFLSVLPPTIYFLLSFNVVVLTTSLVLEQYQIHWAGHMAATILALLVAKVVIVVDKIKIIRRLDHWPLIYPILLKTIVYSVFVCIFRLLEHWVLNEVIIWRLFSMSQIWIFVLFLIYFTFSELVSAFRLSGRDIAQVFFREHPAHHEQES